MHTELAASTVYVTVPGSSSSLLPSPTPSSIPQMQDSHGSTNLLWLWILVGVLGGSVLLFGLFVIPIIIVVATIRKKRKMYNLNSNIQSVHKHSTSSASGKLLLL